MLPLFNRMGAALNQHNKVYTRPLILDLAWHAITLTTPWSYPVVEVDTHINLCTSVSSMKELVLQTMTQLSAHLSNQRHFLYSFIVVP